MSLADIKSILAGTGLPVVYYAWPENAAPALPWICYWETGSNNAAADGIVYAAVKQISIELYSQMKDPTSENAIESALTAAGIFWQKTETYLEDEHCFEVEYEIEV